MEREERAKKRWTDLGEKARKFDSTLLKNAWLDCIRRELSPGAKKLLHASEEEQRETKMTNERMSGYRRSGSGFRKRTWRRGRC